MLETCSSHAWDVILTSSSSPVLVHTSVKQPQLTSGDQSPLQHVEVAYETDLQYIGPLLRQRS